MKLIIPGASGFLGVNLLERIVAHEEIMDTFESIQLVDILQYGYQNIPTAILDHPKVSFTQDSIYKPDVISKLVDAGDSIIHLAVEENTFDNPQDRSSIDLESYIRTIADKGVGKFIFISSADIYGINNSDDILETDEVKPTIVYAANKVAFEAYVNVYHSLKNLPSIIFRPVTIYGPNQFPGWLIPRVITRAIKGEKIQITGDGGVKRDWIYVDDVCSAIERALLSDNQNIIGQAFNLGTGREESVIEVVRYILKKVGRGDELIEFIAPRVGDIPRQITHAHKAQELLNWKNETKFAEGLDATITWYQNRAN